MPAHALIRGPASPRCSGLLIAPGVHRRCQQPQPAPTKPSGPGQGGNRRAVDHNRPRCSLDALSMTPFILTRMKARRSQSLAHHPTPVEDKMRNRFLAVQCLLLFAVISVLSTQALADFGDCEVRLHGWDNGATQDQYYKQRAFPLGVAKISLREHRAAGG